MIGKCPQCRATKQNLIKGVCRLCYDDNRTVACANRECNATTKKASDFRSITTLAEGTSLLLTPGVSVPRARNQYQRLCLACYRKVTRNKPKPVETNYRSDRISPPTPPATPPVTPLPSQVPLSPMVNVAAEFIIIIIIIEDHKTAPGVASRWEAGG